MAKKILLQEGSYNDWGARPIRRVIQNKIESEISLRFLDGTFIESGGMISITGKDCKLLFKQQVKKNKKSSIKKIPSTIPKNWLSILLYCQNGSSRGFGIVIE